MVAMYIDDIIVTSSDDAIISDLKAQLHNIFYIKDLSVLKCFLVIEDGYTVDEIILSQNKFTKDMLHDYKFDLSHKVVTLLLLNLKSEFTKGT